MRKKTARVSTVFAGAAACTAVLAGPAHAGPAPARVSGGPAAGAAAGAGVTPDAFASTCFNAPDVGGLLLHLYYSTNAHHRPACVGQSPIGTFGYVRIGDGGAHFRSYCGGDYSGDLWIGGTPHHFTAGVVYHHLYNQDVSAVSLGWVGSHTGTCRQTSTS